MVLLSFCCLVIIRSASTTRNMDPLTITRQHMTPKCSSFTVLFCVFQRIIYIYHYQPVYLNLLASLSDSSRVRMSPSRTGPFTLRMMERLESSRNSTLTWVHCPWDPVRPKTLVHCNKKTDTNHRLSKNVISLNAFPASAMCNVCSFVFLIRNGGCNSFGEACNSVLEFSNFPEVQNCPSLKKLRCNFFQVEVQFPGTPMIQHINLIWGYKNLDRTFAPTFEDESQLPTFRVANCDAIGENSGLGTTYVLFTSFCLNSNYGTTYVLFTSFYLNSKYGTTYVLFTSFCLISKSMVQPMSYSSVSV